MVVENPFLVGPRLYFRPLEREDASRLAQFINDPDVRRMLLVHRPMSVAKEVAFIEAMAASERDVVFGIAPRQGQGVPGPSPLIGVVGLHGLDFKNQRAEFGISLGEKSEWGKGYATEATRMVLDYAFGTLNLHKVVLQVYANHPAALRVYEKVGFRREGVQREQHYVEGRWVDGILMGILRGEWTPFLPQSATP